MTTTLYLHAGLPRTATTVLQRELFPKLSSMHYMGKPARNSAMDGNVKPTLVARQACERINAGDPQGFETLRVLTNSLTLVLHDALAGASPYRPEEILKLWLSVFKLAGELLVPAPLLYSDEALSESKSGLLANLERSDQVILEYLSASGCLEGASVSIVLREPLPFLRASYYKCMEFLYAAKKRPPMSFEDYLRVQLQILERHPSASRVFLCMHDKATAHFRALCPRTNVIHYRDLVAAPHALDFLLGVNTGEKPVRLEELGRENRSWRNEAVNAFLLSAPGVPAGIGIDDYAATFADTMSSMGLGFLLAAPPAGAAR